MKDKKQQEINSFEQTIEKMFSDILAEIRKSRIRLVFDAVGGKKLALAPEDIFYFERTGRETAVVTAWDTYKMWDKMADIEDRLPQGEFVRCHNSYIVNLSHVLELQRNVIRMRNGDNIMISRSYTEKTRTSFERWNERQRRMG